MRIIKIQKINLKNREKQEEMYQKIMAELLEEEYQNKLKALRQIHLKKLGKILKIAIIGIFLI